MGIEVEARRVHEEAAAAVAAAGDVATLEQVRLRFLGRKGEVTGLLRAVGALAADERPAAGQLANELRAEIESLLTSRAATLDAVAGTARLRAAGLDVTLDGRVPRLGARHPITAALEEIERIFMHMGFESVEGPEVELERYNFELLNVPADHPARDMQDTFYITDDVLLRTHTSPMQVRYMREHAPRLPVRIIVPGRVFRCDDDATHTPMFHQVEGLVVDRGITLGDLKGTLLTFARAIFSERAQVRLRPSYFPFTEPSAEVDVSCTVCGGTGCHTCKGTGWLEILGAGMVHPRVLENGGYDPEEVTGFAFGMGADRIALLKYGVDDLRLFFANDLRLLRQLRAH
jgi:phenylalanyl-tRNA synthetase alpha chain